VLTDDSIPEWDISPLVRSELPGAIREEMNSYVKAAEDFESSYIGKIEFLNDKQLMNAFEELERFMWGANRVRNYCWMNADVNTDDSGVKELVEFGHSGYSKVKSVYAIFEIEITKLLTKNSSIIESQELKPYQYHLSRMREKSIHLLSEEEEKLILEMNLHGRQAWTALHTEFLGSSTRRVVLDNEEREYSLMELAVIPQNSTNRENRRVAMESCHSLLAENRILLSHAYRAICSSYVSEMNKRKWPNVLAYALHEEDIDLSSVLAMQNVLKKNSQLLRKYLSLKASILNLRNVPTMRYRMRDSWTQRIWQIYGWIA
jgi:oligoendopeptidase F